MVAAIVEALPWVFIAYALAINGVYLALTLIAFVACRRELQLRVLSTLPQHASGREIPISLLVPAHNEEATIVSSIRSQLQLNYTKFEIVVINDGSTDRTLDVLRQEFDLVRVPDAHRKHLETRPIRAVYRSRRHRVLLVIDKEKGGKADALNAGINASRSPLFCSLDADSVLQRDSLQQVARPFIEDARTVAAGGIIRVANGCDVSSGFLVRAGLPRRPLELLQVVEYLRAFLFGRMGWSPMNGLLLISGAFGLYQKDVVVAAGGYRTDTVGEDMELVVRLHRFLSAQQRPYRIAYVPDPVCWTEVPASRRVLRGQRIRWQRGLAESLTLNAGLFLSPRGGFAGRVSFPFAALFEGAGPVIEVAGYVFFIVGYAAGVVSMEFALAFAFVAIGLGVFLSVCALLLEEMSFHTYPRVRDVLVLLAVSVAENFGYRQMTAVWRLIGLWKWASRQQARWGDMSRVAAWQRGRLEPRPHARSRDVGAVPPGSRRATPRQPVTRRGRRALTSATCPDDASGLPVRLQAWPRA